MDNFKKMQQFQITVFRQSRVLLVLFLTPISILLLTLLGAEIHNALVTMFLFVTYLILVRYFAIGHLIVIINGDGILSFDWQKKILFNYKPLPAVKMEDIKTIVLDEGTLLRKIKTSDRTIPIHTTKINLTASIQFLDVFLKESGKHNIKIINSWGEFAENGFLGIAYKINTIIIILGILAVLFAVILKGFNPKLLFIMVLFIPQMILYRGQMKKMLK